MHSRGGLLVPGEAVSPLPTPLRTTKVSLCAAGWRRMGPP